MVLAKFAPHVAKGKSVWTLKFGRCVKMIMKTGREKKLESATSLEAVNVSRTECCLAQSPRPHRQDARNTGQGNHVRLEE